MAKRSLDLLQSTLRGLGAGSDTARVLHDALCGAMAAAGASGAMVVRLQSGHPSAVATVGSVSAAAAGTGLASMESMRLVRRTDPETGVTTAAEPLRAGTRVLGALVVSGSAKDLDPSTLALFAAATALVLERHRPPSPDALPELLASLSSVGADLDLRAVLERILDTAQKVLGATGGLCVLTQAGILRVAHHRGIEPERLLAASRLAEFKGFVSGDGLSVEASDHPVVALLGQLGEVAVRVPMDTDRHRSGHLVLLLAHEPDTAQRALIESFARHVATCLHASQLHVALRDHDERLASVVHAMAHPVVVVDAAGLLVEVNGAAAEAFRLASGFERGQPVSGRLGHRLLEEMLTTGREARQEVVVGDQEPRVYQAAVRRMRSADGRVTGRILVMDDMTGRREVDALKADFVAVVGHELRTPLTVVKGYLHTLVRRGATMPEERRAQALGALEANVSRLEHLIQDLLFLSAIDEQRPPPLDLETVDLAAVLADRSSPRVVVSVPPRPVEMRADQAKLGQVVHHLVDNALKHSSGEVVVELRDGEDAVEISVSDSGEGIFSGDVTHVFDRFRQLDASSTRTHGGVGIGLYICRRVVEAMGGTIWCESRLGVGSRFAFTLPKTSSAAPVP